MNRRTGPARYALLIADLDGTLIGADEAISPRVSAALGQLRGRLEVSLATGRPPGEAADFARQLGLTSPQICDGGATIIDPVSENPLWWSAPLSAERSRDILEELDRRGVSFVATYPGGMVTSKNDLAGVSLSRVSAMDLPEGQADVLVRCYSGPDLEVVKMFLPTNGLWGVNFAPAGVTKGKAALQLSEMLGIDSAQIIAAGDSYNDLSLLVISGLRIVMGTAPPDLKDIAEFVAPGVEQDGLAIAIESFLLPSL